MLSCGLMLAAAESALATTEPTTYTATESVPVPPASNFAGSGGGDGWSVALSPTEVFNVFHHSGSLTVACHLQKDASECWSPGTRTITDGSGNNFSTSGHPGMFLDENTGKLYVYATRANDFTGGVVCVDTTKAPTTPDPFCGFTALTGIGEAPYSGFSGISPPMLVGNHLYAFNYVNGPVGPGAQNKMLCFDVSTDKACAGQPFTVQLGPGVTSVSTGSPTPPTSAIGSQLIMPIVVITASGSKSELACFDASKDGKCTGSWPASLTGTNYTVGSLGPPFQLLNSTGHLIGMCLPDSTDECFALDGSSHATPPGMQAAIGGGSVVWNGPGLTIGPRVYVPVWTNTVYCYDAATNASCNGFPKSLNNLSLLYTVNPDPQRPTCIWVNADNGSAQIQNFDAFTGGPCGQGPIRALASEFVVNQSQCTPNSYRFLQVVKPPRSKYTNGSVAFEDGDGNPIPGASPRPIDNKGKVSLTGLHLNTATGLPQFLITLNGLSGSPSEVKLKLSWIAPYHTECIDNDATALNPAITATGTSANATEGKSFTGTVATFQDPDTSAKTSDYKATIDWADGSKSSGTISGSGGNFTVNGTHTYAEEGTFSAKVAIDDVDSDNDATVTTSVKVADAALHAKAGKPGTSGKKVSGTVATFTDDDPAGTVSDYTASINWGDGKTTTGTVSASGGKFKVSGSHTYAKTGTFKITVTIKDKGGSTATTHLSVTLKGKPVHHGSATLTGAPHACARGGATLVVVGKQIKSVTWFVNGKKVSGKTVHKGSKYSLKVKSTSHAQKVTAKVTFVSSSHTASKTLSATVPGCTPHGKARLTGVPRACVRGSVTVSVVGKEIASVTWFVNGKKVSGKTVHKGSKYSVNVTSSTMAKKVIAKVRFVSSSQTKAKTLRGFVPGCGGFTG